MNQRAFRVHSGVVAPLMRPNVDTDAIIPSREMKKVSRSGLSEGLFAGWRYLSGDKRELNEDFVLNQPAYADASILVSGPNFGCGSSREHAVWALVEFGIRVIIAPGFGAIFERNCTNNGLLPVTLDERQIELFLEHIASDRGDGTATVDLEQCLLRSGDDFSASFSLAESQRNMLLKGRDPIDVTLQRQSDINKFLARDQKQRPWVYRWKENA